MKYILKLLCAPLTGILWLVTAVCKVILKISSAVLAFAAVLFAAVSILKIAEGSWSSGIIGLLFAFLLSPYGIPKLAALLLAGLCCLRYRMQSLIYN